MRVNAFYERPVLLKNLAFVVAFIGLCKLSHGMAAALLVPGVLLLSVMQKTVGALNVLFLATVLLVMGRFFVPGSIVLAISQKLTFLLGGLVMGLHVFDKRLPREMTPVLSFFLYLIFMAITSQAGWCPAISNLKFILFVSAFVAFIGGSVNVVNRRGDVRKIRAAILSVSMVIIFGSVLSFPFPAISQMSPEEMLKNPEAVSLFKGVTCHSQMLGPVVAMICTFLLADLVFSIQRRNYLYLALQVCGAVLIYKTSSRTAMASYLAGVLFVSYFAMRSRFVNRRLRSKIFFNVVMGSIMLVLGALAVPSLRERAVRFVAKSYRSDNVLEKEQILGSRRHKLNLAIANWKSSPIIGNGFQVSEDMKQVQIRGIRNMLTAPVEKSTWMYAVLEEGGVIGMILFCIFILVSFTLMIKRKAYLGAATLFEIIMINMGEFTIFAMSAEGGMFWCLVFMALALDHDRNQKALMMQNAFIPMRRGA